MWISFLDIKSGILDSFFSSKYPAVLCKSLVKSLQAIFIIRNFGRKKPGVKKLFIEHFKWQFTLKIFGKFLKPLV